eukprot:COSAG06_NODE_59448_length_274_cov_0.588571_1_plen_60_part_10
MLCLSHIVHGTATATQLSPLMQELRSCAATRARWHASEYAAAMQLADGALGCLTQTVMAF